MTFYVRSEPMPLVIGGFSHGTHVATDSVTSAREVAVRLGYEPVEIIPCPGFHCTCVADAAELEISMSDLF